jgi:hypothetical protein
MVNVLSYTQAAKELGLDIRAISSLVDALHLEPKRHPSNGRAKALDAGDIETIRRALSVRKRPVPPVRQPT